ncbi:MAG: gliding motility protein GldM [Bacteroidia bacterium]|nr:gliding motility protein GldM [Bacteroidia bacterium]
MSGGKETGRQKMIGMMYLVLTALLALQVSSAVLEKFAIINVTLDELKKEGDRKNALVLATIVEAGSKKTSPKVVKAVAEAKQVREVTGKAMKEIEDLKLKMLGLSHTDKVDGGFINDHGSQVSTMMMDPNSPVGKAFEKTLNEYVKSLSDLTGEKFLPLAKAPKDIEFFADDPDHNGKDFLTFTFENTPPIAALASVTQMQTEILDYESKALAILASLADAGTVKFSTIVPMVKPKASIVAAGDKYEAQLFVAAAAEGVSPEMFRNGVALPVGLDPDTKIMMGKIEFLASASSYDANGQSKQTFKTEIKGYGDSTYARTIEYIVAKPVIRVTTGNAPTLYMNCGNTVNIEVPALGTNYNPSFSGKGATIIKGAKAGNVTIIPTERKAFITVINGGATLGTETFDVKLIPKPRYVARDNSGKEIDLKNGVRGASLTGLRVSADAEENFKSEVPKDANYRIRSMEVILARGTARVATINATSELPDISSWRAQFRPGDRIVVDIKTVSRRTFEGKEEKVDIVGGVITIPIQ